MYNHVCVCVISLYTLLAIMFTTIIYKGSHLLDIDSLVQRAQLCQGKYCSVHKLRCGLQLTVGAFKLSIMQFFVFCMYLLLSGLLLQFSNYYLFIYTSTSSLQFGISCS